MTPIEKPLDFPTLVEKAKKLRQNTFKAFIEHGEAHLGGSFSIIEILLALYEEVLHKEDKFILSKAHASFPFCLLLRDKGYNPALTTHLELDPQNGIHCTTGSLGHGLPIATGMALARKLQQHPGNIVVLMSDGECQEGTTWESLLIAASHRLDNLRIIIDYNKIQALAHISEVLPLDNLSEKFRAFNWECIEVVDGHSFEQLIQAFSHKPENGKPLAIIAHTIKGKGIKAFENNPAWHARKIKGQEMETGKKELGMQ